MLENAIEFGFLRQESDRVRSSTQFFLLGKVVQALEDHLHRNIFEWAVQSFRNAVSQIYQDGVEQPGGPNLHLHPIDRTDPKVSQPQLAFSDVESILNAPSLLVQLGNNSSGKQLRIKHVCQITKPTAFVLDFYQAHAGTTTFLWTSQPNHVIMELCAGVQYLVNLNNRIALAAGDKVQHFIGQEVKPGVVDKPQIEQQQRGFTQTGDCSFPKSLIVRMAVFFVPHFWGQQRSRIQQTGNSACQDWPFAFSQPPHFAQQPIR